MTLHELENDTALTTFLKNHPNTLICFSATWCGPCRMSKPTLMDLAISYEHDSSMDVKVGIIYEHVLGEAIHNYNIRAFPTYVLFTNYGMVEKGRIEGVNFDGIKRLVEQAGCKKEMGMGYALGGDGGDGPGKNWSMEEARAHRLAVLEQKIKESAKVENDDLEKNNTVQVEGQDVTMIDEVNKDKDNYNNDDKDEDHDDNDNCDDDVDMEMVDPTETLSKEQIDTLVNSMGFSLIRAQKGLLNSTSGVEGAIEWLLQHQDDDGIDDPIALIPKTSNSSSSNPIAQSYKCNDCGKILSNMANLELHANKTGHSDFSESTDSVTPLTAEEKAAKILEIKELLKVKRHEREEKEKAENVDREKQRRFMGKEMAKTREEMEMEQRKRDAMVRKREKDAAKKERERIRRELEKDKLERMANKGKLSSKLGIDGYHPDAIQYDVSETTTHDETTTTSTPTIKKPHASIAKIDEYITKVSSYRAGGDGGKCLKILLAYLSNIVNHPSDDKYKTIKVDNKVYKEKVKPFIGAKSLLIAVGFHLSEDGTTLVLESEFDASVLESTRGKLEAALEAYSK